MNASSVAAGFIGQPIAVLSTDYHFTVANVWKQTWNAALGTVESLAYANPVTAAGQGLSYALTGHLSEGPKFQVAGDSKDISGAMAKAGVLIGSIAAGGGGARPALVGEEAELMALARLVRDAEPGLARYFRTIGVMSTREGVRMVAGGATPMTARQIAMAETLGLKIVEFRPWHAEGQLIFNNLNLTPLRGVVTSRICPGCASLIVDDLPGIIRTGWRTFYFPWL